MVRRFAKLTLTYCVPFVLLSIYAGGSDLGVSSYCVKYLHASKRLGKPSTLSRLYYLRIFPTSGMGCQRLFRNFPIKEKNQKFTKYQILMASLSLVSKTDEKVI